MTNPIPVAYTFKAELLCPNCTIEALKALGYAELYDPADDATVRAAFGVFATQHPNMKCGYDKSYLPRDYDDPYSYDSDEFPKPVMFLDADRLRYSCDSCRVALS